MSAIEEYMLPCLNKKLFGLDCMGCGLQRAFSLVLEGEFTAAFNMHPAIYSLMVLFVVIAINVFKNFKYSNKIIFFLAIINVIIIVVHFVSKTFLIK